MKWISVWISMWLASTAWAGDGTVLTVNRTGGSVSLYDLKLGVEMARLPLYNSPHEIVISPDGRFAITGEYGSNDNPGAMLVIIDVVKAAIAGKIDLGPNSRPHSLAFLPDNRHAVATMQDSDLLALIDIQDMRVVKTFATDARDGHMVRLSPDGKRAYVSGRGGDGTLSVIFLDQDRAAVVIPTGKGSEGIAVSPDGGKVWVAGRTDNTLSIVDTGTFQVIETLHENYSAGRIEIMPDGRVIVPEGAPSHVLHIYDGPTHREIARRALYPDSDQGGGQYGLVAAGTGLFVTDVQQGRILYIDLTTNASPTIIATGRKAPDGVAFSPLQLDAIAGRD